MTCNNSSPASLVRQGSPSSDVAFLWFTLASPFSLPSPLILISKLLSLKCRLFVSLKMLEDSILLVRKVINAKKENVDLEFRLGCLQLCPLTSQVIEERQTLKGSFLASLICGRREESHVSLFFILISSPPEGSCACKIVLQSLE